METETLRGFTLTTLENGQCEITCPHMAALGVAAYVAGSHSDALAYVVHTAPDLCDHAGHHVRVGHRSVHGSRALAAVRLYGEWVRAGVPATVTYLEACRLLTAAGISHHGVYGMRGRESHAANISTVAVRAPEYARKGGKA